jgi:hypothetical protein
VLLRNESISERSVTYFIFIHIFQLTESERKLLEMISTIGCSISLVGIVLTIFMQVCFWKQMKSPRVKVLLNLCVAIGFTDIFAILEGVARDSPVSILC